MFKIILEIITLVSASIVLLAGGKYMLTQKTEENRIRLTNLSYTMIFAFGVVVICALMLALMSI